jgi:endonuclease/exonuclease/phosphatase family metal-dependent hydrolase
MAAAASTAAAQLRVVSYNTLDGPNSTGDLNFRTVFQAIASSPANGIAKRPDVVALQEQDADSTVNLAALLNSLYVTSSYVAVQPAGQPATDRLGFVYDSSSVTPVGAATLVPSGGTRPHLRAQFRPVGYASPDATFTAYSSHLNATGSGTRSIETAALRASTDALGAGAHAITMGDYNIDSSGEQSYQNLVGFGAGPGRMFDPLNQPGTWHDNGNFTAIHTQSTRVAQIGGGASGGMDDRFDFQLATSPMMDGEGLSYIGPTAPGTAPSHSYRAFGNGGNTFNGNINDPQNVSQPPAVLTALFNASDHLPVVADYQIPARMGVAVAAVPSRVILGASVPVNVTVTNTAPVNVAVGADELDYSVQGSGAVTGGAAGIATATLAGNLHALAITTGTPGVAGGTVSVNSASQAAQDATFGQAVSTTVLAHARPSFSAAEQQTSATIDFGIWARGSGTVTSSGAVHNLPDASGFTAGLDGDSVIATGDTARLSSDLAPFTNFAAMLDRSSLGTLATTYILATSDEDLPGATGLASLTLQLTARVAIGGDATLDDVVNLADFNVLAANFGSGDATWTTADFNRDGAVNLADFNVLAANFGLSAAGPEVTPQDWAQLGPSVPEPLLGAAAAVVLTVLNRWRPRRS